MRISIRGTIVMTAISVNATAALDARAPQAHQHPLEGGGDHVRSLGLKAGSH